MSGHVRSEIFEAAASHALNDLKVMFTAKLLKFLQQKTVSNFVMRFLVDSGVTS